MQRCKFSYTSNRLFEKVAGSWHKDSRNEATRGDAGHTDTPTPINFSVPFAGWSFVTVRRYY